MDSKDIDMLIATYTITQMSVKLHMPCQIPYYDRGFLVQAKSGYKKLSDANGKTIGVSQGLLQSAVEGYASANNLKFQLCSTRILS